MEHWSLRRYLEEAKIKCDPVENERYWKEFVDFHAKLPSRTLQSGITLLDVPGVDDIAERTEIVTAATQKCDSAIVLLRSDSLAGEDDLQVHPKPLRLRVNALVLRRQSA